MRAWMLLVVLLSGCAAERPKVHCSVEHGLESHQTTISITVEVP